jgi:hypothetical protein
LEKLSKKSEFKRLPLVFPDYFTITSTEAVSYIYPQSFTIDWDNNEIFVLYFPGGAGSDISNKRWIVVYDLSSLSYKGCFHAGNSGGEGIVVKTEGTKRFLYVKTSGTSLGKFDISLLPPNLSSLSPISEYDLGLHWQFSYRTGTWLVEEAAAQVGMLYRRKTFAIFDDSFNRKGTIYIDSSDSGFFNSAYDDLIPKRQGLAIGDGFIVQGHGGYYGKGDAIIPYSYQGVKVLNSRGESVKEQLLSPDAMINILEQNGFPCERIENEGVHVSPSGDIYSLFVYRGSITSSLTATEGLVIFKEYSEESNSIDFSSAARLFNGYEPSVYESGIFPRGAGGYIFNPVTGEKLDTVEKILQFMEHSETRKVSFYSSGVTGGVQDINNQTIPSYYLVEINNVNNNSYTMEWIGSSSSKRFWINGGASNRNQFETLDFLDTGWKDLSLVNGAEAYDSSSTLQYRKIGKVVYIRGAVKNISSTPITVAYIPEEIRPIGLSHQFAMTTSVVGGASRFARWQVGVNGDISLSGTNDGQVSVEHWFPIFTNYIAD